MTQAKATDPGYAAVFRAARRYAGAERAASAANPAVKRLQDPEALRLGRELLAAAKAMPEVIWADFRGNDAMGNARAGLVGRVRDYQSVMNDREIVIGLLDAAIEYAAAMNDRQLRRSRRPKVDVVNATSVKKGKKGKTRRRAGAGAKATARKV